MQVRQCSEYYRVSKQDKPILRMLSLWYGLATTADRVLLLKQSPDGCSYILPKIRSDLSYSLLYYYITLNEIENSPMN